MVIHNYVRVTDRKGREVVKRRRPLEDGGEDCRRAECG
jgi:hypothetical protein